MIKKPFFSCSKPKLKYPVIQNQENEAREVALPENVTILLRRPYSNIFKEFFKEGIVEGLVLARTEVIPVQVDLYASGGILQLGKGSLSHDPAAHDPACQAHILQGFFLPVEARFDLLSLVSDFV